MDELLSGKVEKVLYALLIKSLMTLFCCVGSEIRTFNKRSVYELILVNAQEPVDILQWQWK